jgi:hypothetical protein
MPVPVNPRTRSSVLLLAFNRPEPTLRVLEAISAAGVARLYVALDGPRADRPGEAERCAAVADLVARGGWADQVILRRRDQNLGCKLAVTDGLDWFFEQESEGVVLEDDCLPGGGFFTYCDHMLERYREDERVWLISGDNLLSQWRTRRSDYFFGDGGIWGWASWRRAWQRRDITMESWDDQEARDRARSFLGPVGWHHLAPRYAEVAAGKIDTWDFQWSWTRASNQGLSVIPSRNLVTNIGFGPDATHTTARGPLAGIPTGTLSPSLRPPTSVQFDRGYQTAVACREHVLPRLRRAASAGVRRVPWLGVRLVALARSQERRTQAPPHPTGFDA